MRLIQHVNSSIYHQAQRNIRNPNYGIPYYHIQDGVLMLYDIVRIEADRVDIPRPLRIKILEMTHDIPASGHVGLHQTKARLWPHFYWPGISKQEVLLVQVVG